MAKGIKCKLVIITSNGHVMQPMEFETISKAVEFAHLGFGYSYNLYDEKNKLIKSGFCK